MGIQDEQNRTLLTIEDAAKFLKTSKATIYRSLKKGILQKVKVEGARAWLIPLESLEAAQLANSCTLPELAARILKVERKLDFLLTRGNSTPQPAKMNEVLTTVSDYASLQREMQKRFPNLQKG